MITYYAIMVLNHTIKKEDHMKRCKTCGKLNADDALECENCHANLDPIVMEVVHDHGEPNPITLLTVMAVILILVGSFLLILNIVHLTFDFMTILYLASGASILIFDGKLHKHEKQIFVLKEEIHRLNKRVKELKEKNADN